MKLVSNKRACTTLLLSFPLYPAVAVAQSDERPNVVLLYADDIGYGDLSCNGAEAIHTPNVDRLAAMGIRFTDGHSAAATSTPSRYSLLTGEYAWRRSDTNIAAGDAASIIRPDQYTLADLFQAAGYATGVVGKWHLGLGAKAGQQDWNALVTPGPTELGFDYSYIMAATGDRTPCVWMENQRVVNGDPNDPISVSYTANFPGEPSGHENPELLTKLKPSHGHDMSVVNGCSRIGWMKGGEKARWVDENIADSITAHGLAFIEAHKASPFFLMFATNDVHVPRMPHPRFVGKSGMGARGDALLQFDWCVGQVLDKLEQEGLMENTLIILSSDNGPVIDDGYRDKAYELLGDHRPAAHLRGSKYSSYEAGTRVPLLVSWPGRVAQGVVSEALVSQTDLFASLASLVGVALPEGAAKDSDDHLAAFIGSDPRGRDYFIGQNLFNTLSIVQDGWKYIEPSNSPTIISSHSDTGSAPFVRLYDLNTDIAETRNLAKLYPEKVEQLQSLLEEIKAH